MMRIKRTALSMAVLGGAVVTVAATPAADAASPLYTKPPKLEKNYHSGLCLDVYGWSTANGAKVDQWHCYGGRNHTNQQWIFAVWGADSSSNPNPAGQLINVHSHKCLDDPIGPRYRGYSNGARMQQWRCLYQRNGLPRPNQVWALIDRPVNGGNDFEFMSQLSGKALEINGNESTPVDHSNQHQGDLVDQWSFWGGHNQIWYPVSVP
jgi:Ricin-type beta-trefoil lectin domain-like